MASNTTELLRTILGFEAHGILYCLELEHWNCCFVKIVFGGGNMGGFCDQAKVPWLCRNVTD
jgi:hypothetical protein